MLIDEAIQTLLDEIEEGNCEYIADEIRVLIKAVEDFCFELREGKLRKCEKCGIRKTFSLSDPRLKMYCTFGCPYKKEGEG